MSVVASIDGHQATATVTVVAAANPSGLDRIVANPSSAPLVALVDGMAGSTWRSDTLITFVDEGLLDAFGPACAGAAPCGEVILFGATQEVGYIDHTSQAEAAVTASETDIGAVNVTARLKWSSSEDTVTFRSVRLRTETAWEPLNSPIKVPLTVWIAAAGGTLTGTSTADAECPPDGDLVACVVSKHLDVASELYAAALSGIVFGATVMIGDPTDIAFSLPLALGAGWKCPVEVRSQLDGIVASAGANPMVVFRKSSFNAFYVQGIRKYVGENPWPEEPPGFACPPDDNGVIIMVAWAPNDYATLRHELGHALGLLQPSAGHTIGLNGFDASNIMWSYDSPDVTAPRSQLSLGQAFRLSAHDSAWVNRAGLRAGRTKHCQESFQADGNLQVDVPCPRLGRQLVAPP
ncbi:MAG: hypothetical protein HY337_09110 [Gemmatimonadetes bacterium]|nr:hypothetical protein [Gemmatimonadota bacterium]